MVSLSSMPAAHVFHAVKKPVLWADNIQEPALQRGFQEIERDSRLRSFFNLRRGVKLCSQYLFANARYINYAPG